MKAHLGNHIIIDYYQCNSDTLSSPELIKDIMEKAADEMGATIITSLYHHFSPLGVSGVTVISESHMAIHTWPEHNFAAIDIFYCGDIDIDAGVKYLQDRFSSKDYNKREVFRGDKIDLKGKII